MSDRDALERAETVAIDVATPTLAGRYEIQGLLGSGGMGAVYRARDLELGEIVALKMLRPDWAEDPAALERFRSEVRLARRVTHKNVARTFDIGGSAGERFLTMECIDGGSLASRIADGPLRLDDAIDICEAICAGLAAAHQVGVVHRDLKPENVLFARDDGRVVVTDFGIAVMKDKGDGAIIGTPAYMAPEQFAPGGAVDERADLYALGAVIFEMVTGQRAWRGEGLEAIAARARTTDAPDPRTIRNDISGGMAEVVMRCMAPEPKDRFASALDVAKALRAAMPVTPPATAPAPMPIPARTGKTVAVLPLANDGGDEDQYIADGLTDDLIDTLSMTRGLLVRPRSVIARFRKERVDASAAGRELGVHVIVEGSIRRVGKAIRITARLIGTDDGFQLWARRFEAPLEDLLVSCDEVARAIAAALTTEVPALAARAEDPVAVELYLRAKQEFWRSWNNSARAAVEQFERALVLAPSDPRILSGTAQALARMLFFGEGDREAVAARTRELTDRAVVVAPELGECWAALASYRLNVGDAPGAARAIRAGLAHAPNSAMLQDFAGRLLAEVTPLDEAEARLRIALDLDPTLVSARVELSRVYGLQGDFARAEEVCAMIEPSPAIDAHRARAALWAGVAPSLAKTQPDTYARLYDELDRKAGLTDAQRDFMAGRTRNASGRIRSLFLQRNAEIYACVGDRDLAIDAVSTAVSAQLIDLAWLDHCPALAAIRADARFVPLRDVVAERCRAIRQALAGRD